MGPSQKERREREIFKLCCKLSTSCQDHKVMHLTKVTVVIRGEGNNECCVLLGVFVVVKGPKLSLPGVTEHKRLCGIPTEKPEK